MAQGHLVDDADVDALHREGERRREPGGASPHDEHFTVES